MKKIVMCILGLILVGCSSPPKPTPVEFEKTNIAINGTMAVSISENIIPSSLSVGVWSHSFVYTKDLNPSINSYYAIAHADSAEIIINNNAEGLLIEKWLIENGLTATTKITVSKNYLLPVINLSKG